MQCAILNWILEQQKNISWKTDEMQIKFYS